MPQQKVFRVLNLRRAVIARAVTTHIAVIRDEVFSVNTKDQLQARRTDNQSVFVAFGGLHSITVPD
jgi:hypothetical protein